MGRLRRLHSRVPPIPLRHRKEEMGLLLLRPRLLQPLLLPPRRLRGSGS